MNHRFERRAGPAATALMLACALLCPGALLAAPAATGAALSAPTQQQLQGFRKLQAESERYEKASREYRQVLSQIVTHHFEERRRRAVSTLDKAINVEQEKLQVARGEAIRRLEEFVAKYSGDRAHPEATPDAMFRLAALYEERARADFDADLGESLLPARRLYREIIREFPTYRDIAGVHYYLGHALMDSGAIDRAQQAWRSLVCSSRYTVQDDIAEASRLLLQRMPQDHADDFWNAWYNKNPIPLDQVNDYEKAQLDAMIGVRAEELRYSDPYADCEPIEQLVAADQEPRYIAEVWWQLGNYHFDQLDSTAGPYALNRAATAYERSMKFQKPPLYGVAMYKRAWTYFKQQRYNTAVNWFVNLLHYADRQEEETGDPGADFRSEAYTYIAGSLTYVDFQGPPSDHPYVPRNDVLDLESDPLVAEEKMRIAFSRVQDPELIPQDKKWTVEIYKALAEEFIEITQSRNAIEALELTLDRFPNDRDAPLMQNKVADLYDEISRQAPDGSTVREEAASLALRARTKLAQYVGETGWTEANRDDPEAIQQAEELVRLGLQRAAADHTNFARAYVSRARQLTDETAQREMIVKAIDEYRLAATGWRAYINQNPNSTDAYESRFWLADALYNIIWLQTELGDEPGVGEVAEAREAATAVRDSNEDNKFLQPSAYYLVSLADQLLKVRYREHEASGGARGIPELDAVTFQGEGAERTVVKLPIPQEVGDAVSARDGYNARVARDEDPQKNGLLYEFQAAEFFFIYGNFGEATKRFEPIMAANCGENEYGFRAWEKLISMSNFQRDGERSRRLADGKSCAFDEETKAAEDALRTPVKQGVAYLDARALYEAAEKMDPGPERDKKWRQAAAAYKVALDAAPDRDEAPEAAMNGAFAYKQVGEYDKAIEMYELFISRYGNSAKLRGLRDGDRTATPPVAKDSARYEERVKFLKLAYDALANAYVLFFDYPKAAETFDNVRAIEHFTRDERKAAAQQAMNLFASLGDQKGMRRTRNAFASLGASRKEVAEADYVIASSALKQWDQNSPNSGGNAVARKRAEYAMRIYHDNNRKNPAAVEFVVDAAYWTAKMKDASRSGLAAQWWGNVDTAFERFRKSAPLNEKGVSTALGSRQASMAAEGAYRDLDKRIARSFDYETGHHRFKGTPQEVLTAYRKAATSAKGWFDKLQALITQYASPEWSTAVLARQGSLYDSLRTGLYDTRPPELQMFDKNAEAMLRRAEESDNLELQEKADALRGQVETEWQQARDRELAGADQIMVDRYSRAITFARRYNVSNPAVVRAIQRLAFFTNVIGEARLKEYTAPVPELNYSDGMFLRIRPGLVTAPPTNGMPLPSPMTAGQP